MLVRLLLNARSSPEHPPMLLVRSALRGASLDLADDVLVPQLPSALGMEVKVSGTVACTAALPDDGVGTTGMLADVCCGIVDGVTGDQPAGIFRVVPSDLAHGVLRLVFLMTADWGDAHSRRCRSTAAVAAASGNGIVVVIVVVIGWCAAIAVCAGGIIAHVSAVAAGAAWERGVQGLLRRCCGAPGVALALRSNLALCCLHRHLGALCLVRGVRVFCCGLWALSFCS
mmetsp:Transcript_23936/g.66901  ORF Transcript_23936/g.66901 Transcript_23936/m.66901 type:complete len:228 (+) Transcript_23936:217-900(+)